MHTSIFYRVEMPHRFDIRMTGYTLACGIQEGADVALRKTDSITGYLILYLNIVVSFFMHVLFASFLPLKPEMYLSFSFFYTLLWISGRL